MMYTLFACAALTAVLAVKYFKLKRQIRKLSAQVQKLSEGTTEKMLELSLIDRDLEQLAGKLNRHYAMQRQAMAETFRHEELLKESIANISHDLRTPLTVVTGHLQLLKDTQLSEKQRKRVETALRKAGRMKELIGAFYELSVLEAEQIQPCMENVNVCNLLIDFLTENAPILEQKQISPLIELPEESLFLWTDQNMLERILQNIFTNAVRYTAGEFHVLLFRSSYGKVVFQVGNTVKDAGNLDTARIFDRFYTEDSSRHSEGTGLGLAVVKLLTEKLGGTVSAEVNGNILSLKVAL